MNNQQETNHHLHSLHLQQQSHPTTLPTNANTRKQWLGNLPPNYAIAFTTFPSPLVSDLLRELPCDSSYTIGHVVYQPYGTRTVQQLQTTPCFAQACWPRAVPYSAVPVHYILYSVQLAV